MIDDSKNLRGSLVRTTVKILTAAAIALLSASGAQAAAALFGARAGAVDVPKLARFYESVFGLQETNRLELPNLFEIMLNFGDSVSAAKENKNPQIILMRRESDDIKDTVPHLIFTVPDINATIAAVNAAGGKMDGAPRAFNKSMLGFAIDPAGNRIEIIQPPAH
jgi:predicted enzyme related to lactoylglutathione lyase